MCGILGIVHRNGPVDQRAFDRALATLSARGPDQEGRFADGGLLLGHKRLSILDLSDSGRQPMFNETGDVALVFNGEIYNYRDLRARLEPDHAWTSRTDSEVLVHGYETWGDGLIDRIEGMFAFALYDKPRRRLVLARDHFGKKPLYYYHDADTFAFASELKALLQLPAVRRNLAIDPAAVARYLLYGYIPSPGSIFAQVRKVEPSTVFCFDLDEWRTRDERVYWRLEDIPLQPAGPRSEPEVLERVEALLDAAVARRLQADVPVGVFLSGGVDSSLIAHFVARHAPSLEAFTVAYKSSPEADESRFALQVSRDVGIRANLCNFEDAHVAETFVQILDYLDEPMADAAIIPLCFVSRFAREKVTVILSGDGGDEVFGGYPKYRAQLWLERLRFLALLAPAAQRLFPAGSPYRKLAACAALPFYARQFIYGSGSPLPEEAAALLGKSRLDVDEVFADAQRYDRRFGQRDTVNRSLHLDCRIQLPDWYLVKGDRATMAVSLEMRNPLLDKALAEYAFSLDGGWKIRGNESKWLLKRLAARYVGRENVYRPKRGFGVPLDKWIRNELRELFADYVPRPNAFFDPALVRALLDQHLSGERDRRFELLRIFNFNYFLARYGLG